MIYEAEKGEILEKAKVNAIKQGCDKFIHNDKIYQIQILYCLTGSVNIIETSLK